MQKYANRIYGELYLGSIEAARSLNRTTNKICDNWVVISIMNDPPTIKCGKQYAVRIDDEPRENLLIWFDPLYKVISSSLAKGKKVLIHCMAGVSRSATVTAAFLMRKFRWSRDRAILEIEKSRPFINPNKGFMIQLKKYEQFVRDGRAVNGTPFRR